MSAPDRAIAWAVIVLFLVVSCGKAEPMVTVVPPTDTPSPPGMPVLPTATQTVVAVSPTTTTVPPTNTPLPPTATPGNSSPVVSDIADQIIAEGRAFKRIALGDYVSDADNADDEMVWSYAGNVHLTVIVRNQRATIILPDREWNGSETIQFEACDPEGLCDAMDVVFTVTAENDAPVVYDIVEQIIAGGETFAAITLDDFVRDVDHSIEEIAWGYSESVDLAVSIIDHIATVTVPDVDWRGSEAIRFEVCDPEGLCDATEVVFTVAAESGVVITYIGNEGFLIAGGETRILVDALHRYKMPPTYIRLMENALPPFDGIDLVLVTHSHHDHFDPLTAGRHLVNNPQAILVSTEETVDKLRSVFPGFHEIQERIRGVQLEEGSSMQATVNDIEVEMMYLPHSGSPNLGFLFSVEGIRLFHMGDSEETSLSYFQAYQLPGKEIDVVFIPYWYLTEDEAYSHSIVVEGIQAKQVVPMHFDEANSGIMLRRIRPDFPQAVLFHTKMASWVIR